ncbi:unnamed protein product [Arctia plantaginis]|uniref:Uncharacterized protein n=1 Tax=Arctia plantaginis TaxID=874455 RepID=A0A8S1BPS5_ARCPL|nr:unnamed protein product [Arctia plantaginis]CAB3261052.1 unnamed protein product [Arctia plantaginis]CAB3262356.1 unnamed protein product [Arctia plantaginis]
MLKIIFAIIIFAAVGADCKSFIISGPTWKNERKACASGGEHHNSYTFYLGTLSDYSATYEEITGIADTIVAEGDLTLTTGKAGTVPRSELHLSEYSQSSDYKQFRGSWRMESYRGWASQIVEMVLTVKFYNSGKIYMDSYVSAGSWMSVTCADTKAYVERIKVSL